MIVRISGEDQYRLADERRRRLNELEQAVVTAVEGGDEDGFDDRYEALLDFVRAHGERVGDDEIETSDLILPPPDLSFAEAGQRVHRRGPDPGLTRRPDGRRAKPVSRTAAHQQTRSQNASLLDRDSPQREPALEFGLDRQFRGHLRLQLQLALGRALLRPRAGAGHERVPVAALVVVDEVDAAACCASVNANTAHSSRSPWPAVSIEPDTALMPTARSSTLGAPAGLRRIIQR